MVMVRREGNGRLPQVWKVLFLLCKYWKVVTEGSGKYQ